MDKNNLRAGPSKIFEEELIRIKDRASGWGSVNLSTELTRCTLVWRGTAVACALASPLILWPRKN